jgi:hypothetical protein
VVDQSGKSDEGLRSNYGWRYLLNDIDQRQEISVCFGSRRALETARRQKTESRQGLRQDSCGDQFNRDQQ